MQYKTDVPEYIPAGDEVFAGQSALIPKPGA
jgi:hypothetical protein